MSNVIDCPQCSRKLRVAADLAAATVQCPTCGATFTPAPQVAPAASSASPAPGMRCPFCSEDLEANASVCRYCGEDLFDPRPPWERSGAVRRDSLPDRGGLILSLGIAGLICSVLSYCAVIGVPLSITAWVMGQQDLWRMRDGLMDPRGKGTTTAGMVCGIVGSIFGLLAFVLFASFALLFAL
jgi:hypothetical protein